MKVGLSVMFGAEDYLASGSDQIRPAGYDNEAFAREPVPISMAEPLGFSSIWTVEHHFSGYSMMPDPLQLLAYAAAQTTTVSLGTMVVVLPWHNPARLAGSVAVLDNLCDGRLTLGVGRGLGRLEFEGLEVPMSESRERFAEVARVLIDGLERGYLEHDGVHHTVPRRALRPTPVRSFRDRIYASAVSPESFDIMAELGLGVMIVPQKPWPTIIAELQGYRSHFVERNGREAPRTKVVNQVFCDEDAGRARELGHKYIGGYYETVVQHYDLTGDHFAKTSGYSYYERMAKTNASKDAADTASWYTDLHCYGTPEECIERIVYLHEELDCEELLSIFSFADMSTDESIRNMKLFAEKVLPTVAKIDASRRTGAAAS